MYKLRNFALHVVRIFGAFRIAQWLTPNRLRIICYHGFSIGDEYQVQPDMFMRAATFERRMRILRRRGLPVIPLEEAVRRLEAGEIHRRETVITIDDGWASTLTIAAPILERYGFPATVYVTTEHLSAGTEVFNVALCYMVLRARANMLHLAGLHPALDGTYDLRNDPLTTVRALVVAAETAFPALVDRQRILPSLAGALGVKLAEVLSNQRFSLMTREQIEALAARGFDIELHTHRHRLPADRFELMAAEIDANRLELESILKVRPRHFCFPSGEYSPHHVGWLRSIGIASATTCDPGLNRQGHPVMLLRRFLDNDRQADVVFDAEITGFRDLVRDALAWFRRRPEFATNSVNPK